MLYDILGNSYVMVQKLLDEKNVPILIFIVKDLIGLLIAILFLIELCYNWPRSRICYKWPDLDQCENPATPFSSVLLQGLHCVILVSILFG